MLTNPIFVRIYKGDLLMSCIFVCVNTTLQHLSLVPYIQYCNSLWSSMEVERWCRLFVTRWHNFLYLGWFIKQLSLSSAPDKLCRFLVLHNAPFSKLPNHKITKVSKLSKLQMWITPPPSETKFRSKINPFLLNLN